MSGQRVKDQDRADRLAAELRANLKKRKARSRALQAGEAASSSEDKALSAPQSPESD